MGTMESGEELMGGNEERIYVSVRLRPLNSKEILRNDVSDWDCINDTTIVYKNASFSASDQRSLYPTAYTFDRVFRSNCSTREVYEQGAKDVAISVLSGINSSVFAYGQTSSGKTYTMTGITEYAIADIYDYIQKHTEREFVMKFSAMEIYNESVRDLLSLDSTPLRLLDDPERGTIVEKLTEETLRDWDHIIELLSVCEAERQIGETSLNEMSSRSHQIIRLTIESSSRGRDNISTLAATVNFVDLAGSERASQSLSAGARLKEGCHINRSLLTLGTVIRKLSKGRSGHVPYRDSKLTRILQTSLGGNARTAIICTMSPARIHVEQSRNTLLFASCAKEVTTNAQVNVIMSDKALVKYLQRELERLESELKSSQSSFDNSSDYSDMLREKDLQIKKLAEEINDIALQRDIAQSQVKDLLQILRDDATCSTTPVGSANYPHLHMQKSPDSEIREQEASISVDHPQALDVDARTCSDGHSRTSSEDHFAKLHYFNKSYSFRVWEEIDKQSNAASEDQCREVRCIETQESSSKVAIESISLSSEENTGLIIHGDGEITETPSTPLKNDGEMKEDKDQDQDKEFSSIDFLDTPSRENPSPMHETDEDSSTSFKLSKSTSCKARIDDSWTPLSNIMDSSENLSERKLSPLSFSCSDMQSLSRKDSRRSSGNALDIEIDNPNVKFPNAEDDASSTGDVGEKTELSTEREFVKNPSEEIERKGNESPMKNLKDVGLDPIEDEPKGLSSWPMEFKRFQLEIIELWHDCNVSLVHRTYFFMLFQGDPSDAIYLEVELRRLKFLKDKFSQGDKIFINGQHLTLASSAKALRGERQMLTKRMSKKLSEEERENLFKKWGIGLNTKFRRLQLAHRLWSKTEDMDHIKESASLVAQLVRFAEPGQAPSKEMFGLNFTPRTSTRSYSFRRSLISSFL